MRDRLAPATVWSQIARAARGGGVLLALLIWPGALSWGQGLEAITMSLAPDGGQTYSVTLQALLFMTLLTLLPSALIMMTSFTRIVIVLGVLRQGLGTNQTPSNQILVGLAFFLTLFIMMPVFSAIYQEAVKPYLAEELSTEQALSAAAKPLRQFMIAQTRETDLALFAELSGKDGFASPEEIPFAVLVSAFMTSELKTAFQISFMMLIPFLIIDLLVASVLMSMGMMMLSPMIISLPFKIMLFVLIDGWSLVLGTLARSFYS